MEFRITYHIQTNLLICRINQLILKPSWKKLQNLTDNNFYPNILKLDSCFWATELKYRFGNKAVIFFDFFVCFLFGSINNLNIFHGQPQRLVLKDLCSLVPTVRKIFMFPNIVLGISCLILIDCFEQVNFLKSDINFRPLCHKCCFHPILVTWFLVVFGDEVAKIFFISSCPSCLAKGKQRLRNIFVFS